MFPMRVLRPALFLVFAAALHAPALSRAACGSIAALSRNAEYLVLDPANLAVLAAGDLRWLGIDSVSSVAYGSSLERVVLRSFAFMDVESRGDYMYGEPGVWLYLEDLGRDLASQDGIPFFRGHHHGVDEARWSPWLREGTFILQTHDSQAPADTPPGEWTIFRLMDADFNVLRQWRPTWGGLEKPMCQKDGNIYHGVQDSVQMFREDGTSEVLEFDALIDDGFSLSRLNHTKNCKALAYPPGDYNRRILFDFTTGEIESRFSINTPVEAILFDEGNRFLLHDLRRIEREEGDLRGPRFQPLNRYRLLDTRTGEVLLEKELDTGSGEFYGEGDEGVFCSRDKPAALVRDGRTIHLVDAEELVVTASRTLPETWEENWGVLNEFWVFQ